MKTKTKEPSDGQKIAQINGKVIVLSALIGVMSAGITSIASPFGSWLFKETPVERRQGILNECLLLYIKEYSEVDRSEVLKFDDKYMEKYNRAEAMLALIHTLGKELNDSVALEFCEKQKPGMRIIHLQGK